MGFPACHSTNFKTMKVHINTVKINFEILFRGGRPVIKYYKLDCTGYQFYKFDAKYSKACSTFKISFG